MKLGIIKKLTIYFILSNIFFYNQLITEDKISSIPLVNLENLKPSFENEDTDSQDDKDNKKIIFKEKKKLNKTSKKIKVNIVALDKITAKTSDISISLGETKKFGLLEIKALKCGEVNSVKEPGQAAYIQVKDVSDNNNNQVFVFNGWTFSASTTLRPMDHPVYDLWLVSCDNV